MATRSVLFRMDPAFRVGLHGRPIVAGDDKREVVYFGDTINTAARIGRGVRNDRVGRGDYFFRN